MGTYDPTRYALDLTQIPDIHTATVPGPESNALHARAERYV